MANERAAWGRQARSRCQSSRWWAGRHPLAARASLSPRLQPGAPPDHEGGTW